MGRSIRAALLARGRQAGLVVCLFVCLFAVTQAIERERENGGGDGSHKTVLDLHFLDTEDEKRRHAPQEPVKVER